MSTSKVLLCVLGALAAGVTIGVLLRSTETRSMNNPGQSAEDRLKGQETSGVKDLISGSETSHQRAEFDQANSLVHQV